MGRTTPVRLAEVMAAMSLAADIGMGQPMEQGLGVSLVSVRLGAQLGLSAEELQPIYDIALLRHIGCTAENVAFAEMLGDELRFRAERGATVDWGRPSNALGAVVGHLSRTEPPLRALSRLARLPITMPRIRTAAVAVCEVATLLAQQFGMSGPTLAALGSVGERWDGRGLPGRLAGEDVPLAVRIVQVAEAAWVWEHDQGAETAVRVLRHRSGTALDPMLVDFFCRNVDSILGGSDDAESLWDAAVEAEPVPRPPLDDAALDAALRAFGEFADLKSPSTTGHSARVAELSAGAAEHVGLPGRTLRRAGLVHDVGRVGVSSSVWEKPGPLTRAEREQVRLHPYLSERILARPDGLAVLGRLAASHHERLDGSGYHRCLSAVALTPSERLLAAADAYASLLEPRPHRPALAPAGAAIALRAAARAGRLDGELVEAVLAAAGHRPRRHPEGVAGLTGREVEVLRLVAGGLSNREIARRLVIAPKTADAHVQHIYAKLGVSTRAAATVFAMQHDLVA